MLASLHHASVDHTHISGLVAGRWLEWRCEMLGSWASFGIDVLSKNTKDDPTLLEKHTWFEADKSGLFGKPLDPGHMWHPSEHTISRIS